MVGQAAANFGALSSFPGPLPVLVETTVAGRPGRRSLLGLRWVVPGIQGKMIDTAFLGWQLTDLEIDPSPRWVYDTRVG